MALAFLLCALQFAESNDLVRVHVVDAISHAALVGAEVELWTEDESAPLRIDWRVARGVSAGNDGAVDLHFMSGAIRADKARLSAAGHASRTVALSDLNDPVALWPADPFSGRVLDLDDKPVAGAIVRTRETCRHAVPASETVTDDKGFFSLSDCPVSEQGADLEIIPREHIPWGPIEIASLRRLARRDGSVTFHVPHRAPRHLRLIDEHGEPLAHRRVVSIGDIDCSAWTDKDGRCVLPPPDGGESSALTLRDPWSEQPIGVTCYPRDGELVLTTATARESRAVCTAITLIDPPNVESGGDWRPEIYAADGRVHSGSGTFRVARGPARLFTGGDFTPWVSIARDIEIGTQPLRIELTRAPSRHLRALLPAASYCWRFSVQAGPTAAIFAPKDKVDFAFDAPPDEPLIVLAVFGDGSVRRGRLALTSNESVIDLRAADCVVRAGLVDDAADHR